ncbi:MAG: hypothetical protein HFE66_04975 [Clostridiales bacterium]|jgi:ComEC/Rec2-related protein|nr:hypothetical protein [Clostridiales bacterium]
MNKELRLRPLFGGCLGMYLGAWSLNTLLAHSIWGKQIRIALGVLLCLAIAGVLLLWFRPYKIKERRNTGAGTIGTWLPFVVALLTGCCIACLFTLKEEIRQERYDSLAGQQAHITGIIMEEKWSSAYSGIYTVYIDSIDGEKDGFLATMETKEKLEIGGGIKGTVSFEALGAQQTFDMDQREYSRSKGVRAEAVALDIRFVNRTAPPAQRILLWGKGVQKHLSAILTDLLGDETGGFASALFLGNRDILPDRIKRDFSRLGISHILALSGMHLTVVTGFAGALGRRIGRRWGTGFSIGVALLYMVISGFTPSVTRAGIMLLICMFLKILGKGSDSFTNLGIAVCTILLCSPGAARDVGLLLSFWGVLAVLLYSHAAQRPAFAQEDQKTGVLATVFQWVKSTGNFFLLSVCVVLFMLPLTCLLFGQISLVAPIACVIFSPLATMLLWLLPLLLLVSPSPLFTGILLPIVQWICNITIHLSETLARLRNICVSTYYPFAPPLTIAVFCFVLWALAARKGKRRIPVFCSLATILVFGGCITGWRAVHAKQTAAVMINSGMDNGTWTAKNDGLVVTYGERALLIDITAGGYSTLRRGAAVSKPLYCTEIEAVMLTHLHNKHIESLEKLWNREMVRQVWVPDEDTEAAYRLYEKAAAAGVEIVTYTPGETLSFLGTRVVTHESDYLERSVQPIIRLDVEAGDSRLVYLGASWAEAYSLEEFQIKDTEVLWFGAHGPLYKTEVNAAGLSGVKAVFCTGQALEYVHIGDKPPSPYCFIFPKE